MIVCACCYSPCVLDAQVPDPQERIVLPDEMVTAQDADPEGEALAHGATQYVSHRDMKLTVGLQWSGSSWLTPDGKGVDCTFDLAAFMQRKTAPEAAAPPASALQNG